MIGFVFWFCLLFRCSTSGWVMLGLVFLNSSGFLCVSSHYSILPRVSSLLVQGLGVSAPTPKSQGLISSFAWLYIFFSSDQVCLSTLSWCSACTSVSEDVFLMYPWRKIYSTSTYSSAIFCFSFFENYFLVILKSLYFYFEICF